MQNRKIRILLVCSIALVAIAAGGLAALMLMPTAPQIAKSQTVAIGGPFTLTATDGRTITDRTYRGKWVLLYFGYSACPDDCPTALNDIGVALDRLGPEAGKLQPLFITVDPKRDTREVLSEYLKSFDPRIVGLTGREKQVAAAIKEYRVYVAVHRGNGADYTVDHSSFFYLVNPDGKFVNVLPGNLAGADLARRLRTFMQHTV